MSDLSPALARLETLLREANGGFVPGRTLASAINIPMLSLSGFVAQLRRLRPGLAVEGRRGKGYRMITPAPPEQAVSVPAAPQQAVDATLAPEAIAAKPRRPPAPSPGQYQAAATTLLDLIGPHHAEIVRAIALDSGETVETAVYRLIAYGIEVHRDLVGSGANPLALRRPRAMPEARAATRH